MKIYKIEDHRDVVENETIRNLMKEIMFNPTDGRISSTLESVYGKVQGRFYVAEDEDIIGIIGVRRVDNAYVEIMHMVVEASHRNKGIGKQLINHVNQSERVLEIKVVANESNYKFFKKVGFKAVREEDPMTGKNKYLCHIKC